jgi:hypothetical protein
VKLSKFILVAMAASSLSLGGCATASRFEWGSYDASLYAYSKNPAQRPDFELALKKAIEAGDKTGRVAPGMHAELGYLYLDQGDRNAAGLEFAAEMRAFPESRSFLQKYVQTGDLK